MVPRRRVVIVAKADPGSGNLSSAARIQRAISRADPAICGEFFGLGTSPDDLLLQHLIARPPLAVLCLHLRRCAFLTNLPPAIPIVAICGGTDLNEDANQPELVARMTEVVRRAKAIVVFSPSMQERFTAVFGAETQRRQLWMIPQGIELFPSEKANETTIPVPGLEPNRFFVVVGRLRKVKDPCFVIRPFYEWNVTRGGGQFVLVFLGAVERSEEEACEEFLSEANRYSPTVRHVDNLPAHECQRVVRGALALINCSRSEGQSVAILEAMAIGTPVLARSIPGNCDLVIPGETGLLFDDAKSFKEGLSRLADQPELRHHVTEGARALIRERHCAAKEGQLYLKAIRAASEA